MTQKQNGSVAAAMVQWLPVVAYCCLQSLAVEDNEALIQPVTGSEPLLESFSDWALF
jgi:hypothetical protein